MQSPSRRHDRQSFVKYVSADTARLILESCSMRWSSPILFNDPFDVPRELSFGVTPEQLSLAMVERLRSLIEHPPVDTTNLIPQVRLIVEAVKRGITAELKHELLAGLRLRDGDIPSSASMDEFRQKWRNEVLPDFRILCLTESPSHAAMWYHYADAYAGAVLQFRCIDELDSAWLAARKIDYLTEKPLVYTAAGWAELMTEDHSLSRIIDIAAHTKSPDWSYEQEWRITTFRRPLDTGHFTDYTFKPAELSAVYFGPRMKPAIRASLLDVIRSYPHARPLDTRIGMSRELLFSEAS